MATAEYSPNRPRPEDPLTRLVADALAAIERNYEREGSGPGSRFEGRLLEDVQAEYAVRQVRAQDPRVMSEEEFITEVTGPGMEVDGTAALVAWARFNRWVR